MIDTGPDDFGFVNMEMFKAGFAGDTSDEEAAFLRDSQVPINMAIFGANLNLYVKQNYAIHYSNSDSYAFRRLD